MALLRGCLGTTSASSLPASALSRFMRGFPGTLAAGVGAMLLMAEVGHSDTSRTTIYYSLSAEPMAKAITEAASPQDYELKQQSFLGLSEFCSASSAGKPAIVLSLSEMSPHTEEDCRKNKLGEVAKAELGFATLVLVQKASDPPMRLNARQIYLALANLVPGKSGIERSKVGKWSDVDPDLPDLPVKIFLPPEGMNTRHIFDGDVMVAGCREFPVVNRIVDSHSRTETCVKLRKDVSVQVLNPAERLEAFKHAGSGSIAFVQDSSYELNKSWLRVIPFNGLLPTPEDVVAEDYTLASPIYAYAHADQVSGDSQVASVRKWFLEAISERAIGDSGYLDQFGFTGVPSATREWQRKLYEE